MLIDLLFEHCCDMDTKKVKHDKHVSSESISLIDYVLQKYGDPSIQQVYHHIK